MLVLGDIILSLILLKHLLDFCIVLLCILTFRVPCCDVRYDLRKKRCSVRLYLQLFVKGFMFYLRYLCLFAYSGVQRILCCVLFSIVLCCQFLWIVHFWLALCYSITLTQNSIPVMYSNVIILWVLVTVPSVQPTQIAPHTSILRIENVLSMEVCQGNWWFVGIETFVEEVIFIVL